jgi:hypothetical protein
MTRYRLPDRVLRAPLQDEEVLLNAKTGIYHLLNETGRTILADLEARATVADVVRRECEATGEPNERVRSDVEAFVAALSERGLLEIDDAQPS